MGRLEPILLIAPRTPQALLVSHNLNDFTPLVRAGIEYDAINKESLIQLPTKTFIDLKLYSAQAQEDQLRELWPQNTNTRFLSAKDTLQQATQVKNQYREAVLHDIAVDSPETDGFFSFIELYAVPLVNGARALEEADIFPTLLDGYAREATTDAGDIVDKNNQAIKKLKGYVHEANLQTTDAFLEVLYTTQNQPVSIESLCENLVTLGAINRKNPPTTEGIDALLGVHKYR